MYSTAWNTISLLSIGSSDNATRQVPASYFHHYGVVNHPGFVVKFISKYKHYAVKKIKINQL